MPETYDVNNLRKHMFESSARKSNASLLVGTLRNCAAVSRPQKAGRQTQSSKKELEALEARAQKLLNLDDLIDATLELLGTRQPRKRLKRRTSEEKTHGLGEQDVAYKMTRPWRSRCHAEGAVAAQHMPRLLQALLFGHTDDCDIKNFCFSIFPQILARMSIAEEWRNKFCDELSLLDRLKSERETM